MNNVWKFEWLTSWEEIWDPDFVNEWQNWMESTHGAAVFYEPSVVKAWILTYAKLHSIQPRFLIARFNNSGIVFLPLVYIRHNWKSAWLRMLLPVGYTEFDYHDPIVVGSSDVLVAKSFWKVFSEELLNRWKGDFDVAIINGLRMKSLPNDIKDKPSDSAPFINLMRYGSIQEFMKGVSQSLRGDINRQMRRLEQLGKIELHVYANNEMSAALMSLKTMLEEHKTKWPKSYKAPGFHELLIRNCLNSGILHISELLLDNQPISWHIGFNYKSRYYWYMPVYRPEFQQYSPGKMHLYMCIAEALRKGITVFDLLKGDEDYKRQWTKDSLSLFSLKWRSKSNLSSLKAFLLDKVKPNMSLFLKRALKYHNKFLLII
jgi:CelD/BcsL family acetyltransferase involved in cellulose biosynthesis